MTFDTFDTYNTDEAYKDKGTTAKGLVAAYKKDNPNGTKEDFYSKLNKTWAQDKDGYVKNAVEEAFKVDTPKEEEKVVETVKETAPEETKTEAPKAKTSTLDKQEKEYIKEQDELADTALNTALNDTEERRSYNWEQQYETARKSGEAFSRIDDKMIEQLPTFLYRRYQNGEFGDISDTSTPEGRESKKNAKLRLAHFVLNGVQSKLKNASNAAAIAAGRAPMFSDTTSDYEKYQQSNLAKGMENRWKKYEAETENAIQLASKESMTEQEARLEAEKIANDKKMATKWNMMDARQKVDLMTIKKEIGNLVGDMDLSEIADFMTGEAISGDLSKDEAIAIGVAQLIKKTPGLLAQLPEGKYKDMIIGMFGGGDVNSIIASLGGANEGGVIDNVVNAVTDKGNTYKEEGTKKGNVTDKLLGLGNVNMSDETMNSYYALSERKPEGITTDLPTKDIILKTMSDYPDKGVVGIVDKSGTTKAINKQFSEIDNLASQATKEFKKDGNLEKYQNRMKELYDYRNELQAVFKNFGKAPIPGNSIQSDYDKAFSNKEANFRKKYSKQ